jgi:hypothetical protein
MSKGPTISHAILFLAWLPLEHGFAIERNAMFCFIEARFSETEPMSVSCFHDDLVRSSELP